MRVALNHLVGEPFSKVDAWSEANRNVSGEVSGHVTGGRIQARVDAGMFAADLTVHTNGNHQSVSIVPQGSDVRRVVVTCASRRALPACDASRNAA
jgi:hypothetical protein